MRAERWLLNDPNGIQLPVPATERIATYATSGEWNGDLARCCSITACAKATAALFNLACPNCLLSSSSEQTLDGPDRIHWTLDGFWIDPVQSAV
jgi:hypothetical protein